MQLAQTNRIPSSLDWISPAQGERRAVQRLQGEPLLAPLLHLLWSLDGPPAPVPKWPQYDGDALAGFDLQLEAWAGVSDEVWRLCARAEHQARQAGADSALWRQYRQDLAFLLRRREPVEDESEDCESEILAEDLVEID